MLHFERIKDNTYAVIGTFSYIDVEEEELTDSKGNKHLVPVNKTRVIKEVGVNECDGCWKFDPFDIIPGFEGLTLKWPQEIIWNCELWGNASRYVHNFLEYNLREQYNVNLDWAFLDFIIKNRREELDKLDIDVYRVRNYNHGYLLDWLRGDTCELTYTLQNGYILIMKNYSFFYHFFNNDDIKKELCSTSRWCEPTELKLLNKIYNTKTPVEAISIILNHRINYFKKQVKV